MEHVPINVVIERPSSAISNLPAFIMTAGIRMKSLHLRTYTCIVTSFFIMRWSTMTGLIPLPRFLVSLFSLLWMSKIATGEVITGQQGMRVRFYLL